MNELLKQHCVPLHGQPPMDPVQIQQHLAKVPGWTYVDAALERTFSFKNYYETIAFLTAVCGRFELNPVTHHALTFFAARVASESLSIVGLNAVVAAMASHHQTRLQTHAAPSNNALTFAAQMKSFIEIPPTEWVSKRTTQRL